jgi:hypothetical protein
MATKYFKWFADKKPLYGQGEYVLDGGWQPKVEGDLVLCQNGYHVCTEKQLSYWRGTDLAEVEVDPDGMIESEEKCVVRTFRIVRWTPWTIEDMCDCAHADVIRADCAPNCSRDGRYGKHAVFFAHHHARLVSAYSTDKVLSTSVYRSHAAKSAGDCSADACGRYGREMQAQWIWRRIHANEKKAGGQ